MCAIEASTPLPAHVFVAVDQTIYRTGDRVTGLIVAVIKDSSRLLPRSIELRIVGYESVSWSENPPIGRPKARDRSAREEFFMHSSMVWVASDDADPAAQLPSEGILRDGTHTFPFEFELPRRRPGTFRYSYGIGGPTEKSSRWVVNPSSTGSYMPVRIKASAEIRYVCTALLWCADQTMRQACATSSCEVNVAENVSEEMVFREPLRHTANRTFPFGGDAAQLCVTSRLVYFAQDPIDMQLDVHNRSSYRVSAVRVAVDQLLRMSANGHKLDQDVRVMEARAPPSPRMRHAREGGGTMRRAAPRGR